MSLPTLVIASPIVQVTTGIESSRFVDGQDISGGKPAVNLAADVSFENGSFAGVDCYKTETQFFRDGIDTGCNYYLGFFKPINNEQAFSATVSHSEYAPIPSPARQWDYTSVALSWHASRSTILTVSGSDNWFGRGYTSLAVNAAYQHTLSEKWSANVEAGFIDFESRSQRNSLSYGRLGLRFEQGRWGTELKLHLRNTGPRNLIPFETDRTDVSLSLSYRLY